VRLVTIPLEEAERILRARGQNYVRPKGMTIIKVHALKSEVGVVHGIGIWGRIDEVTAKRVHIWTDGSPLGWTTLYGQACRALGSDGFTMIVL